ncbi:MAG: hypothetical protein KC432_07775, partial [Thermomicrobiales bacterium]|nr:hypothetical protein [Thermomicrobiales bacterium]
WSRRSGSVPDAMHVENAACETDGQAPGQSGGGAYPPSRPGDPATLAPATCLTAWCVAVDTFCKAHAPDPPPSLCGSEVVTLAIFEQ